MDGDCSFGGPIVSPLASPTGGASAAGSREAVAAYSGSLADTVHCSFFRSLLVPYIISLLQAHAQTPRRTLLVVSCILG
jgi:hypothetical protein